MIFIQLIGAVYAVQKHRCILFAVSGKGVLQRLLSPCYHVPYTVALHVVLCDHIKTVLITEAVDVRCVLIM